MATHHQDVESIPDLANKHWDLAMYIYIYILYLALYVYIHAYLLIYDYMKVTWLEPSWKERNVHNHQAG